MYLIIKWALPSQDFGAKANYKLEKKSFAKKTFGALHSTSGNNVYMGMQNVSKLEK